MYTCMSCIEILQKQTPEKIQTEGGWCTGPGSTFGNISKYFSWSGLNHNVHVHISIIIQRKSQAICFLYTHSNSYFLILNAIINTGTCTFTIFKDVKRHFYLWISMTFKLFRNMDFSCVEINWVQFLYRIYANYAYELFMTFVMRSSCFWMWRSLACLEPSTLGISCQGHHCIPM